VGIGVVVFGYVGVCAVVGFAELGHNVVCYDKQETSGLIKEAHDPPL
jgi:UDP-glucose 6-dehydrogenase